MEITLDLETIPGPDRPDPSEISAPANYKDPEKIRAYQEAQVEEAYRKQELDSMKGQILCIGYAFDDREPDCITVGIEAANEEDVLGYFSNEIIKALPHHDTITWIGHNALAFDMLWIWRRAYKYRLPFLTQNIRMDRYRSNIQDTMLMWCGADTYNGKCRLSDIAAFLGCGCKTNGMDGSQVYDYWQQGKLQEIANYCKGDVELTRNVYRILSGFKVPGLRSWHI
jgi:predicted PolB exonuclease-like 3'-5' exonuclease